MNNDFSTPGEGMERREFLRVGGTLALAGFFGLSGCVRPSRQKIVPYVNQPERLLPGKPLYYATALEFAGFGRGVVVETHEGRPTKVEGNPLHPASLGATSVFEQATLLDLYNPARSGALLRGGEIAAWPAFLGELQTALAQLPPGGAGLHLLTGTVTSPAFAQQWQALQKRYPAAQWHTYEPLRGDAAFAGVERAFGRVVEPRYDFARARTIVSLDADFLFAMPGSLRYAREFVAGRDVRGGQREMNRLHVLETAPTLTGASADDRRALRLGGPDGMAAHAAALARKLGIAVATPGWNPGAAAEQWAEVVARDLETARGRGIVLAGAGMPPELHVLAHAMNGALGNAGQTVFYADPVEEMPGSHAESIEALAQAIGRGEARILMMLGGDWAHTAPADLQMEALIRRVPLSVHLGMYRNRTADAALWHVPEAHPFEAWSDTRAFDGTASIAQPLIEPLLGGRTRHELLDCVAQFPGRRSHAILRHYWRNAGGLDEAAWRRALHDGVVPGTAAPALAALPAPIPASPVSLPAEPSPECELVWTPDYGLWDGRFAENAWLQELPRPITRLSWENALLVAPATAAANGWNSGDVLEVAGPRGRTLRGAALIQPGMAEGALAVSLGAGGRGDRRATPAGAAVAFDGAAQNAGIDAYPLRTSAALWRCGVTVQKTGARHLPVTTQQHQQVHGRDLVRMRTVGDLPKPQADAAGPTFYNLTRTATDGHAWGMVIDLTRCIGCNACALACQAENNIPPVGRREVERGREMHWLRIDAYHLGPSERPAIAFQPMPCMHCETAPCELVCPVAATLHDHEGLNVQVYNRCIGTRYCSNNCPYKVRRFNFLRYAKPGSREPLLLGQNPNVTVRTRGVMEKCTYCVQRITAGRIAAETQGRALRDGEVTPACAQACPTEAIIFGDCNDPQSRVARWKRSPLNYTLLEEANTMPRTSYLMRITNPPQTA